MTFGGFGFLLSKVVEEIMTLENKKDLYKDSGRSYLA